MTSYNNTEPEFFDVFFDLVQSGHADVRHGCGGWVPEVYDLMEGDFEDDIPLVIDLARKTGAPVVDLGSGTGRLTFPLACEGLQVFAVDSDPKMQERLLAKASELYGSCRERIVPMEADIQTFRLPQPARLAVCSTNTFLYLGSIEEQRRALKNIHSNMADGGMIWLDVFVPKPNPSSEEPYLTSHFDPNTGLLLLYGAHARENAFAGTSRVNAFTIVYGRQKQPEMYVQSWDYAWLHPNELNLLLESTGFEMQQLLGDYEGCEADEISVQMIAVARKVS